MSKKEVQAMQLPIQKLRPFENHPFQVKDDDDEMDQLVWSVLTQGVLTPLVVRPLENGEYEVISGHRRLRACQKAGIETVPALIYALDRDAAAIALVDSNLHREKLLPSEKAFAYKLKRDALNHQGKTSPQLGEKLLTVEKIGLDGGDSKNQVLRYIRLTELIPEILSMVDSEKNRTYPGGGTVLSDPTGTAGFTGNHGERGLHPVPVPSCPAQKAEPVRGIEYGQDF